MSERDEIIPDAVWETAHYAVGYDAFKQAAIFGTSIIDSRIVEVVARAILAERERCAMIADRFAHRDTGREIAEAIRGRP